jgi:hypothetical protein
MGLFSEIACGLSVHIGNRCQRSFRDEPSSNSQTIRKRRRCPQIPTGFRIYRWSGSGILKGFRMLARGWRAAPTPGPAGIVAGNPERVGHLLLPSIPYKLFIPFDSMLFKEGSEFVLKGMFFMMLLLAGDVLDRFRQAGFADRKNTISALPGKFGNRRFPMCQPVVGHSFEFFHPVGDRQYSREATQQMNMVLRSPDEMRLAIEFFRNPSKVGMQFQPLFCIFKERKPVFRGEYEVQMNGVQ